MYFADDSNSVKLKSLKVVIYVAKIASALII